MYAIRSYYAELGIEIDNGALAGNLAALQLRQRFVDADLNSYNFV